MKTLDVTSRYLFMGFLVLFAMEALAPVAKTLLVIFLLIQYAPTISTMLKEMKLTWTNIEEIIIALVILFLVLEIIGLSFLISMSILAGLPLLTLLIILFMRWRKSRRERNQQVK